MSLTHFFSMFRSEADLMLPRKSLSWILFIAAITKTRSLDKIIIEIIVYYKFVNLYLLYSVCDK